MKIRWKLGHKIALFWLLSMGLSMALVGIVFVLIINDIKTSATQARMSNGFNFVYSELEANSGKIFSSIENLSERRAMIASVNLISSYQDINNYSPIIFDVEKEKILAQIQQQARSGGLDYISVFDAGWNLSAYYSRSSDGTVNAGFTTYEKGQAYLKRDVSPSNKGLPKIGTLPLFITEYSGQHEADQFSEFKSYSSEGLLIGWRAAIVKKNSVGTEEIVGYVKTGKILGAGFAANILSNTGFKFSLVLPGNISIGQLDPSVIGGNPRTFPTLARTSDDTDHGAFDHEAYAIAGQTLNVQDGLKVILLLGKEKEGLAAEVTAFRNASFIVLAAVALLIVPPGIFYIGHYISSPIRNIVSGFEMLRGGEYPLLDEVAGNDEMNQMMVSFNITSETLKKRERELRRLSTGIEQSPVMVVITDYAGCIEYVNPKFEEVTGYDLKAVLGQTPRLLKIGSTASEEYARIWDSISAGKIWRGEFQNKKKNGDLFWEHTSITPIRGKDGEIESYLSVGEEITERKHAEQEIQELIESLEQRVEERTKDLKNSEDRLIKSQNFANIGTWDWNVQTGDLYWSNKIAPLFGYPEGNLETTYDNFLAAVHPDDRQNVIDAVNACVEVGADYNIEHRTVWPDGTVRYLLETGDVVRDENGTPLNMLGVVQDITERKKAEEQLQESEERTRLLLQSAGEGIYGLDNHGMTTFVNTAACEMLGYREDELIGQHMHALIHHSYPDGSPYPREECPIYAAFTSGEVHSVFDEVMWRKNGEAVPVHYSSTPIYQAAKLDGAVITFSDVTEARKRELELKRSNMELQDFAYAASHDLQEPLRKIQSFSERLESNYSDSLGEKGHTYIDRIVTSATRMRQLIDDLLNYSRITTKSQPFQKIDFGSLMHGVLGDLETSIDEASATVTAGDLPTIEADPTQIRQLMQNLISNSIKFRRQGENLSININGEILRNADNGAVNAGECEIIVSDNGIGFDPKFKDRIFGVFERLHGRGEYPGTGIGLATCKKIVERHGGSIEANSSPGGGAAFSIKLPLKQNTGETI